MYLILIGVILYIMKIGSTVETLRQFANYSNANDVCKDKGGLVSNTIFDDNNGEVFLDSTNIQDAATSLEEGDTVWIKGYAEFSEFITWQGCYSEKHSVVKTTMHNTSVYECLHYCITHRSAHRYIGLRKDLCYCLLGNDLKENMDSLTDIQCNQQKPYYTHYRDTDTRAISVFTIVNTADWDPHPPSLNQCVYAKSISTTYKYATTSCHGNTDGNRHGFICENGATQNLNKSCDSFYEDKQNSQAFCVNNNATSWLEANQQCIDYSGKLVDFLHQRIAQQLPKGNNYWVGMFRSFKITGETSRIHAVPTACLAVTKVMDSLVLDPDNCSTHKLIICTDGENDKSSHSVASRKHTNDVTTPRVVASESNKSENKAGFRTDFIYITVAVSLIAAVTLISCFVVKSFKRTPYQEHLLEQVSKSVGYDNDTVVDNKCSTNACSDVSIRRELSINRPNKPSRMTLKRQTMHSPYENFKLKLKIIAGTHTPIEKANEDYDRIELKGYTSKNKTSGVEDTEECNVYDHATNNGESENYDTIKSTKPTQYIDTTTYNTLRNKTPCKDKSQNVESEDNSENSIYDAYDDTEYNTISACVIQPAGTEANLVDMTES